MSEKNWGPWHGGSRDVFQVRPEPGLAIEVDIPGLGVVESVVEVTRNGIFFTRIQGNPVYFREGSFVHDWRFRIEEPKPAYTLPTENGLYAVWGDAESRTRYRHDPSDSRIFKLRYGVWSEETNHEERTSAELVKEFEDMGWILKRIVFEPEVSA